MKNFLQKTIAGAFCVMIASAGFSTQIQTSGKGLWSENTTWNGGIVPAPGDSVLINASDTVTVDMNVNGIALITVNGVLVIGNNTTSRNLQCNKMVITGSVITGSFNAGHTVEISGNLVNNGVFDVFNDALQAASVTLTGTVSVSGNSPEFYHLVINGDVTAGVNLAVKGNFTINGGKTFVGGSFVHSIGGNWTNSGTFTSTGTTIAFAGDNQDINAETAFNIVEIKGTGTKTAQGNITIGGLFTVFSGATFDANGKTLVTTQNIVVNNGGTLEIDADATLQVANTKTISNSGTFKIVGTAGHLATVTRNTAGNYSVVQSDAAAVFHAQYFVFDYLAGGGIQITNGSIDAVNNFSNGTFSNGGGNQYIDLTGMNFGDFTASNVVFNAGPTYNVKRISGTGTITFADCSGALSGEANDLDDAIPGTLIKWTYPTKVFYSKATGNFNTLTNWSHYSDGTGDNPVAGDLTSGLATFIVKDGHTITINTDIDILNLQVGQGTSGIFNYENNTTIRTITIRGSIDIKTGGTFIFNRGSQTVTHILNLNGDLINNGTFDIYEDDNSLVNTTVAGNIQISGSGSPYFSGLVINTGFTLNAGSATVYIGKNYRNYGTLSSTGTISFNGAGDQTIYGEPNYNHVVFDGSAGNKFLYGSITTTGNMTVSRPTYIGDGTNNFTITVNGNLNITATGLYQRNVDGLHTLTVKGNLTNNGLLDLYQNNTTRYTNLYIDGNQPHAITSATATTNRFYHVYLNNSSNTTTVNSNVAFNIVGDLTIGNGATLTTQTAISVGRDATINTGGTWNAGNLTHTVYRDWRGNGTFTSTGTINFNGGNQYIYGGSGFYNVQFTVGNTKYIAGDVTITNNLETSYTLTIGDATGTPRNLSVGGNVTINGTNGAINHYAVNAVHTLTINGNIILNDDIDLYTSATRGVNLVLNSNAARYISGSGTTCEFFNITLNNNSNRTYLQRNINVYGDIIVNNASTFDLEGYQAATYGNITINNGGQFDVDANSQLSVANTKLITNNGTFRVLGTSGNIATVTRTGGAGGYSIIQNDASAVFHARYYTFSYLAGGLAISNGTINSTNNFSDGTFNNGAGSTYLNLTGLNFTGFNCSNVVFSAGPTYNVTRTSGTGTITFVDASGTLAGENFDNDNGNPGTLINWSFPANTYYSQSSSDFSNLTNWTKNADGSGGNPGAGDLTSGLVSFIIKNGHTITIDQDITVKSIQVGQGAASVLTIGNSTTVRNVTIKEGLTVETGSTLNVGNFSATHFLTFEGNLTNKGTVTLKSAGLGKADVTFSGTDCQVIGPNMPVFNNFNVTGKVTANVNLDIKLNVTLGNGATFAQNSYSIYVAGDWTETGTGALTGTGTLYFNGSNSINGTCSFNNINFQGVVGIVNTTSPVTATGNFTISNGCNFNAQSALYIAGNFAVTSGVFNQSAGVYTYFDGTSAQTINAANANFQYLNFRNGGTSNKKTIAGDMTTVYAWIESTAEVTGSGSHTFTNGLRVDGTCSWSGQLTFTTGGNITGNVDNITLGTANIVINGPIGVTVTAPATQNNLNIGGNFLITGVGYIVLYNNTFLIGTPSKQLTVEATRVIYMRGTNNFPTGFGTYSLDAASTAVYDMGADQVVRGGITYGNLNVRYAYTKTLDGELNVDGALNLQDNVNADFRGFNMYVAGNITNAGATCTLTNDQTVYLDAPNANTYLYNGLYNFNNFTILNPGPSDDRYRYIQSNVNVTGNFVINNNGGGPGMPLHVYLYGNTLNGGVNFTVGPYVTVYTNGASSFRTTMNSFTGTKSFDQNSTVNYYLDGLQYLATGFAYGNLDFGNNGEKRAQASLDINGWIRRTGGTPTFVDGGLTHYIAGDWLLGGAYYTQSSASGTIVLDGIDQEIVATNFNNLTISGTGTKTMSTGTVNIYGNLTISNNVTLDAGGRDINLTGNFINSGTGVFTQTALLTFNSTTADQTFTTNSASSFGGITITKSTGPGNQTVTALSNFTMSGTLTLTADQAIFDITGRTAYIGGSVRPYNNTSFITTGSTIIFNGTSQQLIRTNTGIEYNNVEFINNGEKRILSWTDVPRPAFIVNGNFTITGANVDPSNVDQWGVNVYVRGNWTNTGTFQHNGRTIYFDGADQLIGPTQTFYAVSLDGTGTKTLTGEIKTGNNFTISDNVTLDVSASNYSVYIGGSWNNGAANSQFNARQGTVTFNGGAITLTTGGNGDGKKFYNLNINTTGNATLAGALDVDNNLEIQTGSLVTSTYAVNVGNNFNVTGGTFNQNSATSLLTLDCPSGTKIFNPGATSTFYYVAFSAGTTQYTLGSNWTISNSGVVDALVFSGGSLDMNAKTLTFLNDNAFIRINSGSVLEVDSTATITLANNARLVNQGGTLKIVGTPTGIASVERNSTTGFNVEQTSGTLHMRYYKIDRTIGTGFIVSGGSIDATNNFSDGTFTNGAGNAYLTLTNWDFTDFTAQNINFQDGPTYNISRTAGTGTITIENATGPKAGEAYDQDNGNPGTLINWSFPAGLTWTGLDPTDATDWNQDLNWLGNTRPDASQIVYLNHDNVGAEYTIYIKNADATAKRIVMNAGGGNQIHLELQNGYKLSIAQDIEIQTLTSVAISHASSKIEVGTNWSNAGTFNAGSGTVVFNGPAGNYFISPGGTGATKVFYNMEINATGATYELSSDLKVNNNLTITKGTLDVSTANRSLYIEGNWEVGSQGTFTPQQGTVYFQKAGDQTISGGPFYNLQINTSGTKQLLSNISITSNLTIGGTAILDGQTYNIFITGNWLNNNNTSAFTQTGSGTVIFNRSAGTSQVDNGTSATTFNHLTFANAGEKVFYRSSVINGDLTIAAGSGRVYTGANTITGNGTNTFSMNGNANLRVQGVSNFPASFETITIEPTTTVEYYADLDQTIYNTTYGNLYLRCGGTTNRTKTLADNITVAGTLTIFDVYTLLDASNRTITLAGNLSFPTGGQQINWGTGTLIHNGLQWEWFIDADITSFYNLTLSGQYFKRLSANLLINGDLTVENGTYLDLRTYTLTGTGSKTFTVNSGGRVYCAIPAPGVAFPTGFGTYSLSETSSVYLNANNAVNQIVYSGATYGNLTFSNYNRTITSNGTNDLNVDGNLDVGGDAGLGLNTYVDGGKDLYLAGALVYINNYTPSSTSRKLTLDGSNQQIRNVPASTLSLANVVFAGGGTKTFGDGGDNITISKSLQVNNAVTVTCGRPISFTGDTWTNNGTYTQTGSTVTFSSGTAQTINPGTNNQFINVVFTGAGAKTLTLKGIDINGTLTIDPGSSLDMGTLTHTIAGTITNNGTWITTNANLTFDGAGQTIPSIDCMDVICAGTGTKTMAGDWTLDDLTINSGVTLTTTATNYAVNVKGNWLNSGTFTSNSGKVTFLGTTSPLNIDNNVSTFFDVELNPSVPAAYNLVAATTRIRRQMIIQSNATLNLSSKTLVLGVNITGKQFTVDGTLNVNEDAYLKFDNRTEQCIMNVGGNLIIVGSSLDHPASISRENTGTAGFETQINITGNIQARYYYIEYLSNAGMDIQSTATLHPVNNFSDGTWSNIYTGGVGVRRYMTLNCPDPGTSIANVTFNYSGTPVIGTAYNVKRDPSATGSITFAEVINGNLGGYQYEDDDASATTGKILWPAVTSTTWLGGTSGFESDWFTATNWDPAIVPGGGTNVQINNKPNKPIITGQNAVCRNLTIDLGGQLTLDGGWDITVNGNLVIGTSNNTASLIVNNTLTNIYVNGFWTRGTNGIFVHGNSTVYFTSTSGAVTITPGTTAFYNVIIDNAATEFAFSGATINIDGYFKLKNGTVRMATSPYNLNIKGDYENQSGTFMNTMAGTTNLTGTGNQNITNSTFYNVSVGGSGTKTFSGIATIVNTLTVSSTLEASAGVNLDINGNVTISSSGTFNDGGETHYFGGALWTGTGAYTGTGTIVFDRAGNQSIAASKFNNLTLNNTGAVTFNGNVTLTGNFEVQTNNTSVDVDQNQVTNTTGTGTFLLGNGRSINVRGTNNFPDGFATYSMDVNSRVYYNGARNQTIKGITYYDLYLNEPYTKSLAGNIEVIRHITFNNSTLDVTVSNYAISIGGNWYNNTAAPNQGTFIGRSGNVTFNGNLGAQYIYLTQTTNNDFYNVYVNKSSSDVRPNNSLNPIIITNNLEITAGSFNANGQNITVGGNLLANTGSFTGGGTFILNKASGTATIQTNGSVFNNFTINSSGGATFNLSDAITVNGNFILTSGIFNANNQLVNLGNGTDNVSISGTYTMGPGGILYLGESTSLLVNSGGTINIIGSGASVAKVSRNPAQNNYYTFAVEGTIAAKYAFFEFMGTDGIYIKTNGTVDLSNNFSYTTFSNGMSGQSMLHIDNAQDLTGANRLVDVAFPTNAGGGAVNVLKSVNSGNIELYNASGMFAGENFDGDNYNRIEWTGAVTFTWDGSAGTNWYTADNWTPSQGEPAVPNETNNVIIPAGLSNYPVINTSGAKAKNLTINQNGYLYLSTGAEPGNDLTIDGDFNIYGLFQQTSANDTIFLSGSWYKAATGNPTINGTVIFTGSSSPKSINNGSTKFYNIVIEGGSTYQLTGNTEIRNNLIINSGNFDVANYTLTLGGNLTNNANFLRGNNSKVIFNATSGTKTINNGASSFINVDISANAAAIYQISGNPMRVYGNLQILTGTLSLNGNTLIHGDANGSDNITISSALDINANSILSMNSNSALTVNSGGTLKVVGNSNSERASITRQSAGNYSITVNNGGNMQARYYHIQYTNINGVWLKTTSVLHATNNFSDGEFSNGLSGGCYLKLEHNIPGSDTINLRNVIFNAGPTYNISRTTGNGVVRVIDASGIRGSYMYEQDAVPIGSSTGKIIWVYTVPTTYWAGNGLNGNWNDPLNWASGLVPDASFIVYIPDVSLESGSFPVINATSGDAVAATLTILSGGQVSISQNANLTVGGDINNSGILGVATGSTSVITCGGSWINQGTFTPGASTVTFNAASGSYQVTTGGASFSNIRFNGAATFTFQSGITVTGNFTIDAGTVTIIAGANTINVAGNWTNNATFNPQTSTVVLNGTSGTQNLTAGTGAGKSFYVLNKTGNSTLLLLSDLEVSTDMNVSAGNVNANSRNLYIGGKWNSTTITGTLTNASFVFNGSGNQTFKNNNYATLVNLTMNKPSGSITLNSSFSLSGNLTLTQGRLILGAYYISFGTASTVTGGSQASYIQADQVGTVRRSYTSATGTNFTFPIGDDEFYTPFTFALNSGTVTSGYVSLQIKDIEHPNLRPNEFAISIYLTRYWVLEPTGISGLVNYNASFVYADADIVGDETKLFPVKYSGGTWTHGTTPVDWANNRLTWNGITSFSDLTATGDGAPLPVTLVDFNAKRVDKVIELDWATASEQNNSHFIIEKIVSNNQFTAIGKVDGAGNSLVLLNYQFTDQNPLYGYNYYRLRQVDFDGKYSLSPVVSVNYNFEKQLSVYPNPVNTPYIWIEYTSYEPVVSKVEIYSLNGELQFVTKVNSIAGLNRFKLDLRKSLPQGIYIMRMMIDGAPVDQKITIQ